MLSRLTRNKRKKAGWIVSLVYLLCILAPTLSSASTGNRGGDFCFTLQGMTSESVHMHSEASHPVHVNLGGHGGGHSPSKSLSSQSDDAYASSAAAEGDLPEKKGPHTTSGQCCALMCIGAMPAPTFEAFTPSAPAVARVVTEYRFVAATAPAEHYRPPIA